MIIELKNNITGLVDSHNNFYYYYRTENDNTLKLCKRSDILSIAKDINSFEHYKQYLKNLRLLHEFNSLGLLSPPIKLE